MRNKLFITIVAAFVIVVFLYAPIKRILVSAGALEMPENRNTVGVENVYSGILADELNKIEELKATVADTYVNYLPFYVSVVANAQALQNAMNKPTYDMLSDMAADAKDKNKLNGAETDGTDTDSTDTDGTETDSDNTGAGEPQSPYSLDISFMKQGDTYRDYKYHYVSADGTEYDFIDRAISLPSEKIMSATRKTTADINRIAAADENVNVYVYIGTKIQDTPLCAELFPDEESTVEAFEYMQSKLNPRIKYDYLRLESIDDRVKKLFFSDHHWTAIGANEGYCQIVSMMSENYPDIEPAEWFAYHTIEVEDIHYCGSYSEQNGDYTISDSFSWYDYSLPYHVTNTGESIYNSQEVYLSGKYEKGFRRSITHYQNFYGDIGEVNYPFNDTGRNLLMICDSYARPLVEPLASHFDNTYVLYPWWIKGEIDYKKYIKDKNITDVLFIGCSFRLIGNGWDDFHWELIR